MGKYKHGQPNAELTANQVAERIEQVRPKKRQAAYVWLLYWIGLRRSEPSYIFKRHIREENNTLFIEVTVNPDIKYSRLKHGLGGGEIELPLEYQGVMLIKEAWQHTRKGRRVFPFSDKTGYRIIKKLFPHKSPHWFRHNRITKLRKQIDGKNVTVDDIKSFTGIRRDTTIQHYGMKTQEGIKRIRKVLE